MTKNYEGSLLNEVGDSYYENTDNRYAMSIIGWDSKTSESLAHHYVWFKTAEEAKVYLRKVAREMGAKWYKKESYLYRSEITVKILSVWQRPGNCFPY